MEMQLAGALVRRAGVYSVTHQAHRPTHQVVLQQGEMFPFCRTCGIAVRFDFAESLTESNDIEHIGYDPDFVESVLETSQNLPDAIPR
jgi:hypothetical protein